MVGSEETYDYAVGTITSPDAGSEFLAGVPNDTGSHITVKSVKMWVRKDCYPA